ncbi:MAG: STAS domain-containing protein [Gemmatimonadaceae bacterium]
MAETRVDFRAAAMECLDRSAAAKTGHLRIDMSGTEDVDASGLGTLVVLQKRARERGLTTQLCATQPQVRSLLAATKLEALFEFAS